jgi:hypothetical protein
MLPLNSEIQAVKQRGCEKIFCNEAGGCVTGCVPSNGKNTPVFGYAETESPARWPSKFVAKNLHFRRVTL